jgi:hypothetical protein
MRDGKPQIWGNGDVTIAIGMNGFRVWIEIICIEYLEEVKLNINSQTNKQELELRFKSSQDPKEQLIIEENIRVASTLPWIKII